MNQLIIINNNNNNKVDESKGEELGKENTNEYIRKNERIH
jgi:hypothetical protein